MNLADRFAEIAEDATEKKIEIDCERNNAMVSVICEALTKGIDEGMMHPDRFATDLALAAGKAITVAECCEDDGSEAQNLLALVWLC